MVIKDGGDEGVDEEDKDKRADTDRLQHGWAPKEGGNSSSKVVAAAEDAAEDAAADAAADKEADVAADAANRALDAATVTSPRRTKGTTTVTTPGHAGTACPNGTTARHATIDTPATKKGQ